MEGRCIGVDVIDWQSCLLSRQCQLINCLFLMVKFGQLFIMSANNLCSYDWTNKNSWQKLPNLWKFCRKLVA